MFRKVNLSNLENILQKNLRTDRARECIFPYTWAGASSRFFGTDIGVIREKIIITTMIHFLQLIVKWV